MTKHAHKMEQRYTLKLPANKSGKAVYLHQIEEQETGETVRTTLYWNLYPTTMFTKDRLEQVQRDVGCGGRIIRNGEVPSIPLVPA